MFYRYPLCAFVSLLTFLGGPAIAAAQTSYMPPDVDLDTLAARVGYPATLEALGDSGVVEAYARIDSTGAVKLLDVYSDRNEFSASVHSAIHRVRFTPARWNDVPVTGYIRLSVNFRIEGASRKGVITVLRGSVENPLIMGTPPEPFVPPPPAAVTQSASKELPSAEAFVEVEHMPWYDTYALSTRARYPELARRNNIEGEIIVRALLDKNGSVQKMMVDKSPNVLLELSALKALSATRFTPAMQGGRPVALWIQVPITFRLK